MAIAVRSSEIELLLYNHVHSFSFQAEMETISRTELEQWGISAQWFIFTIVKEMENSQTSSSATGSVRRIYFQVETRARTSVISIDFRQAEIATVVSSRASGERKEEKKITILFNIV